MDDIIDFSSFTSFLSEITEILSLTSDNLSTSDNLDFESAQNLIANVLDIIGVCEVLTTEFKELDIYLSQTNITFDNTVEAILNAKNQAADNANWEQYQKDIQPVHESFGSLFRMLRKRVIQIRRRISKALLLLDEQFEYADDLNLKAFGESSDMNLSIAMLILELADNLTASWLPLYIKYSNLQSNVTLVFEHGVCISAEQAEKIKEILRTVVDPAKLIEGELVYLETPQAKESIDFIIKMLDGIDPIQSNIPSIVSLVDQTFQHQEALAA